MLRDFFKGKELIKRFYPEEAIAYVVAIQAAIIRNYDDKVGMLAILDVFPFSLGIETIGGVMSVLISRNRTILIKKTQIFSNYVDNQTSISIKIYEGESLLTKNNKFLGILYLDGIPPMPRGQPEIEITCEIDINRKLTFSAIEKSSRKTNSIIISKEIKKLIEKNFTQYYIKSIITKFSYE